MGDVNGDGNTDLLVSGYPNQGKHRDTISVVSTRDGIAVWTISRASARELDPFGWNGCAVSDVNGDGITDAAIVDEHELVLMVDGKSGEILRTLPVTVRWTTGILAPIGDLDSDGMQELIVYEGWQTYEEWEAGDEGIKPLKIGSCLDGHIMFSIDVGPYLRQAFSPGDVDGDGVHDIAYLGSEGFRVVRPIDSHRLHFLVGVWSTPGRGDLDRDGCDDLLVTRNIHLEVHADPPPDLWRKGTVEIISGKTGSTLRAFTESVLPPAQ